MLSTRKIIILKFGIVFTCRDHERGYPDCLLTDSDLVDRVFPYVLIDCDFSMPIRGDSPMPDDNIWKIDKRLQ